ncbi:MULTISPECIES: HAD family hydrolase [Actinoalloteichus]|uniref:HAD superfamily hydrolase n=1 Tax=Actinoalloteichus fjordicus TaxID=1612552 RepID=A0AAC9L8Z8_9PSEU|nr:MULTISPECIES: HAD family hydrolase [Actinoalloteichus]APU12227.1 putative HAD superfamily hydrolase [Actinoalloteichus fjordicus]APU18179.1 putative HAD superfamily hydrolase [Actinoalloteichus sp. GBA129-24]
MPRWGGHGVVDLSGSAAAWTRRRLRVADELRYPAADQPDGGHYDGVRTPRLVASDIDGTLLDPLERLRPRTADVIGRLSAAGVPFVLATGRSPRWVTPISRLIGVAGPAVCVNGAVILDTRDDRVDRVYTLDPILLGDLGEALQTVLPGCGLAVERVEGEGRADFIEEFRAGPGYLHPWPESLLIRTSVAELFARPAVRLMVRHDSLNSTEMVDAVTALLGDAVDVTFSTDLGLIDLMPAGVTKASGLSEVAAGLGRTAEDVIAFGDMPNDLAMLSWAGHGVAMANAHPAVLSVADEVTASNAEDGVAKVLERWF